MLADDALLPEPEPDPASALPLLPAAPGAPGPGSGPGGPDAPGGGTTSVPGEGDLDMAAAAALARVRAVARDQGLRPGSRPKRRRRRATEAAFSTSRADGRDPQLLGEQMERLMLDRGWRIDVSVGSVMGRWPAIVGPELAQHCTPVTFTDGVLTVRADSTAWATQLRYMTSSLLARLDADAGEGVVTSLRITGPAAPSWSKGPRRSTGPGPGDTYG